MRSLLVVAFLIITIAEPAVQKTVENYKNEEVRILNQHSRVRRADGLKPGRERSHSSSDKWDGPIVFAGGSSSKDSLSNRGGVGLEALPTPSPCPDNQTFCEAAANYPIQLLNKELLKHGSSKLLLGHFFVEEENTDRFNDAPETLLCPSTVTVVFPKVAQTTAGDFRFVVNTNEYKQGIRVEVCQQQQDAGSRSCDIPGTLSNSYTSHCVQRYIKRTLVVLKSNTSDIEGLVTEPFDFPSCCSCTLSQSDKFGGNIPPGAADRFGNGVPPSGTVKIGDNIPHGASHAIGSSALSGNTSMTIPAVPTSKGNSLNSTNGQL